MSKICNMCGKGPLTGNQVSHSNRKTRRRWLPNLQKTTVNVDGNAREIRICTRCLRTIRTKTAAR